MDRRKHMGDINNQATQKLAIYDPNSPPRTLQLFPSSDSLPQGYRLVTTEDVQANPEASRAPMPGLEIANLANGTVAGLASLGSYTSDTGDEDLTHKLAILCESPALV